MPFSASGTVSYKIQVKVNGQIIGNLNGSRGDQMQSGTIQLPTGLLLENNTVTVQIVGATDRNLIIKRAVLTYSREYNVASAGQQVFDIKKNANISIGGFTAGEIIRVFDITKFGAATELSPALKIDSLSNRVSYNVPVDPLSDRRIVVVRIAPGGDGQPDFFSPGQVVVRSNSRLLADAPQLEDSYLMIGPEEFAAPMERLRAYRSGQGVDSQVIKISDIYDEYSYGRSEPQAITEFLRDASRRWAVKPKFVLLAGNTTFDPKNNLGSGVPNRVPTIFAPADREYMADDIMFDIQGDIVGDFY